MTIGGAIAELQNLINADDVPFYYKGGIEKVIETISMEILTTEQSSKVGEWLPIVEATEMGEPYIAGIYCSACGETLGHEANFCPSCGTKMKG